MGSGVRFPGGRCEFRYCRFDGREVQSGVYRREGDGVLFLSWFSMFSMDKFKLRYVSLLVFTFVCLP